MIVARRPLARGRRAATDRSLEERRSSDWARAAPPGGRRRRTTARDRALPGAALGDGLRARPGARATARAARRARTRSRSTGVDLVMRRDGAGEGVDRSAERGELRFAPGGDLATCAASRWSVDGDLAALDAARRGRRAAARRDYPDALGARVGGADLPDGRRRAALAPRPARSSSTGAAPTTSAAAPRLAAPHRLARARCCGAGRGRHPRDAHDAVDAAGRRCRWCRPLRAVPR